ncbi:hypothetical protein ACMZOO_05860 [Catenovulum sp. SX2]|uniref:hypothetical protein n=1 Tax=Catenovulum sp. SX2 TaxID=3398614 RepID=UPI003F83652B
MHWSDKLSQNPKRSWRLFLTGLAFFWLCASALIFIPNIATSLLYPLVFLLLAAFTLAVYGYLGIFATRVANLRFHKAKYKQLFSERE